MRPTRAAGIVTVATTLALGLACSTGPTTPAADLPPDEPDAGAVALARGLPFATLELPANNRPHAPAPPVDIPLSGWRAQGPSQTIALPIRTRNLYFTRPSHGMELRAADGTRILHRRFVGGSADASWTYDAKTLDLHGVDDPQGLTFRYPKATEREARLNLEASGLDPADFARASLTVYDDTRNGLLLPAPGTAAWTITVPPRAHLSFAPGIVPPEIADGPPSDGASLTFRVTAADGTTTEVWSDDLEVARFAAVDVDLTAWGGQEITLTAHSDPGADTRFDYVFVGDPVVATKKRHPKTMILVFVDTVRPDRLSTYGHDRPTTPALDALAASGVRFDQARSIAPWTLPSARTMITGVDPEYYFATPTIAQALGAEGWATAMLVGNLYLSPNFGLHREWGLHHQDLLPMAGDQVDLAIDWLDEHAGRDRFLLMHLMDPHLPYKEPSSYRDMFAGTRPPNLRNDVFHLNDVRRARLKTDADRQYLRDRYDQNLRYSDDELKRLWDHAGDDAVIVYVSDHGEEFWDHDGFEHGHTLYDELLHVPLVVRAPGLPAGVTVDTPVSMLDVTPTLLDLAGVESTGRTGKSLLPLWRGDEGATETFADRHHVFGRPLYGRELWGVLEGSTKYLTLPQGQEVYDLDADVRETNDLFGDTTPERLAELRDALSTTLGRPFVPALRIAASYGGRGVDHDTFVDVTVPGGIRAAWVGEEPTESSRAVMEWTPGDDHLTARWVAPWAGRRDIWVVPEGSLEDALEQVELTWRGDDEVQPVAVPPRKQGSFDPDGPRTVIRGRVDGRGWEVLVGLTPLPPEGGVQLSGRDDETLEALKAMGYMFDDEAAEAKADDPKKDDGANDDD